MFLVKTQNAIEYFSDNYGHILAIFDMLTFFFFIASKMEDNYYSTKHGIYQLPH